MRTIDGMARGGALTASLAHRMWDVLESQVQVNPADREMFVGLVTQPQYPAREFRFQGSLGFGGKLYPLEKPPRVVCYPEDATSERERVIAIINTQLKQLQGDDDGD